MFFRVSHPALRFQSNAGLVRKTILLVLIGLMGGGPCVFAQQATDAVAVAPDAATATTASTAPATPEAAPAPVPATDTVPVATPAADAATAAADAPQAAPSDETKAVAVDTTVATPVSATVGTDGKPVATKGKVKNVKKKKEKAPKLTPVNIVQGTLTVDGWTGKARMNYDIADLKYIYLWAPGVGTVVVSNVKFPLGKEEPNAFSGNTLKVDANGHTLELYSQKKLLKDKKPVSAWVYVDNAYQFASAFPAMGYGTTIAAPYAWPGAKVVQMAKTGAVLPPPLPKELVPAVAKPACVPAGSKAAGTPCPVTPAAPEVAPATATATTATSRTTQTN